MKKTIIFITLLIFIPFFIVIFYNKNYKEIELNYINVNYIRVKRLNTDPIYIKQATASSSFSS